MKTFTTDQAKDELDELLKYTTESHEPVQINGKNAVAVLVSEEDWRSIEETLYLLSIPGMREKIVQGIHTPIEECSEKLDW